MSAENRTRYEVQGLLIGSIKKCFEELSMPTTGFVFMEDEQTALTTKKDVFLVKLLSSKRIGWPKITYLHEGSWFGRKEEYLEQQEWEIRVLKRRPANVTDAFVSSSGYADYLKTWFNGLGNAFLRAAGVSNLYAQDTKVDKPKDDSALFQEAASITVPLLIPKSVIYRQNVAEIAKPETYPI